MACPPEPGACQQPQASAVQPFPAKQPVPTPHPPCSLPPVPMVTRSHTSKGLMPLGTGVLKKACDEATMASPKVNNRHEARTAVNRFLREVPHHIRCLKTTGGSVAQHLETNFYQLRFGCKVHLARGTASLGLNQTDGDPFSCRKPG